LRIRVVSIRAPREGGDVCRLRHLLL